MIINHLDLNGNKMRHAMEFDITPEIIKGEREAKLLNKPFRTSEWS